MKPRIKKIASKGVPPSPVPHRPWQESVDDFDLHLEEIVDQESEEAVVDLWLEDPHSFVEAGVQAASLGAVQRIKTGGTGLRRHDPMTKTATTSSWDEDFADMQNHVQGILGQLK